MKIIRSPLRARLREARDAAITGDTRLYGISERLVTCLEEVYGRLMKWHLMYQDAKESGSKLTCPDFEPLLKRIGTDVFPTDLIAKELVEEKLAKQDPIQAPQGIWGLVDG